MRTPLVTYHDILDFLIRRQNASSDARVKTLAQDAILSAYQELPLFRNWKYFYVRGRIKTDADYSTGTIEYTHTGGSSERLLTLTDGVWPTNAARGLVKINSVEYSVASRIDDTNVTLSVNSNPGEDIAAGTGYTWWRDVYPMPLDWRGSDKLIDHNNNLWIPGHRSPGRVLNDRANDQTANEPWGYSFISDPDYVGAMAVQFNPPPTDEYNVDFIYQRSPMPMRVLEESTGTVSVSSTTVTGTGTSWNDDMVGALIRFPRSGVNQVPTGLSGLYPYAEQRVVTAVASSTSLTIDAVLSGAYSGVKYRISDFIDIDYHTMMEAFRKLCEYRFSENAAKEDQGARYRSYTNALTIAKEADGKRDFSYDCPAPVRYWNRLEQGAWLDDVV